MIGGASGLSTGREGGGMLEPGAMAPEEAPGHPLRAYGLLHERAPAAVVATLDEARAGLAADVVVAGAGADPESAARALDAVLAEEALGVLVVPAGARRRLLPALEGTRLALRAELLPLPATSSPERLVSLDRHVLAAALPAGGRLRAIRAGLLRSIPGTAATARLRTVAHVVERAGPVRYGVWLQRLLPDADPSRVIVRRSRGRAGVVAVWPAARREAAGYVKLGAVRVEAAALERLAPQAASAGARVPSILALEGEALATSALAGRPASDLLAERPDRFADVATAVALWLERWHDRSAEARVWTEADTERWLLAPLAALDGLVEPSYGPWLRARAAAIEGGEVAFAPAHGDLTMANVVVDGNAIGVVDWEEATAHAPPFLDLPYALADAAAARQRYLDRPAAFAGVFGADGPDATLASSLLSRAALGRGLRPAALSLAFHACWLQHAANDVGRGVAGRPFVAVAAAVAAQPERYDPFLEAP
jgi:hypothetical protein